MRKKNEIILLQNEILSLESELRELEIGMSRSTLRKAEMRDIGDLARHTFWKKGSCHNTRAARATFIN